MSAEPPFRELSTTKMHSEPKQGCRRTLTCLGSWTETKPQKGPRESERDFGSSRPRPPSPGARQSAPWARRGLFSSRGGRHPLAERSRSLTVVIPTTTPRNLGFLAVSNGRTGAQAVPTMPPRTFWHGGQLQRELFRNEY